MVNSLFKFINMHLNKRRVKGLQKDVARKTTISFKYFKIVKYKCVNLFNKSEYETRSSCITKCVAYISVLTSIFDPHSPLFIKLQIKPYQRVYFHKIYYHLHWKTNSCFFVRNAKEREKKHQKKVCLKWQCGWRVNSKAKFLWKQKNFGKSVKDFTILHHIWWLCASTLTKSFKEKYFNPVCLLRLDKSVFFSLLKIKVF